MVARWSSGVIAVAIVIASALAHAGDAREESRTSFRRGVAQAEHGDYAAARDSFLAAYRLYAHPSILLNLGIARWRTGELVEAEQDLAKFLADDGGASQGEIASARAALAATRDHLGTLRARVSPEGARATLDGKPIALVPGGFAEVRATLGDHLVVAEAEGYARVAHSVHVAHDPSTTLDLSLLPAPASSPDGARVSSESYGRVTAGWTLVGVAVASAGLGAYAGVRALGLASAYDDPSRTEYQDHATKSAGLTLRTVADVAFGAALVAGGIGAYLLLVRPSSGDTRAAAVVEPGFAGIRGSF